MRVIPHISAHLIQQRGRGGVEAPRSLVSHYQPMPHHHHCHHMTIDFGLSYFGGEKIFLWKTSWIQVSLLPRPRAVATWQWNNVKEGMELEKKGEKKEGAFDK